MSLALRVNGCSAPGNDRSCNGDKPTRGGVERAELICGILRNWIIAEVVAIGASTEHVPYTLYRYCILCHPLKDPFHR